MGNLMSLMRPMILPHPKKNREKEKECYLTP
jgi:hypothetical protein